MFNQSYIIILLSIFLSQCSLKSPSDTSQWIETIGEMKGPPSIRQVHYIVNGREYKRSTSYKVGNIYEAEYVKLRYNPDNPIECKILRWQECFLKDESTFFVLGEILELHNGNFFHPNSPTIHFSFEIDDIEFEKVQYINPNYLALYFGVSEGSTFKVECWTKNPQRAIMHLDKPIDL